jgi:hypothetical protein
MDDHIQLITHKAQANPAGSNCSAAEVLAISRLVPTHVTPEPRGSILLLADFSGPV